MTTWDDVITAAELRQLVAERVTDRLFELDLSDASAAALCWPDQYPLDDHAASDRGHQRMLAIRLGRRKGWSADDLVGLERGLGLRPHKLFAPPRK